MRYLHTHLRFTNPITIRSSTRNSTRLLGEGLMSRIRPQVPCLHYMRPGRGSSKGVFYRRRRRVCVRTSTIIAGNSCRGFCSISQRWGAQAVEVVTKLVELPRVSQHRQGQILTLFGFHLFWRLWSFLLAQVTGTSCLSGLLVHSGGMDIHLILFFHDR